MAEETKIGWTDYTVNPWEGCMKVSPGCDHCYAEADNRHWRGGKNWGPNAPRRRVKSCYDKLKAASNAAIKSGHKMRVFTASIADIFEKPYPVEGEPMVDTHMLRLEYFKAIEAHPELTFLLLTKRPQNINKYVPDHWKTKCPANVWFGCTVVNQEESDRDIPYLLRSPGTNNKFLSIEPMLEEISLAAFNWQECPGCGDWTSCDCGIPWFYPDRISWVIVGGESGHGARPINPEWVQSIIDQCIESEIPVFFKQWGSFAPNGQSYTDGRGVQIACMERAKNAGNVLNGKTYEDYPKSMTEAI